MEWILKFRLPNLCTIVKITKIKKGSLKKKRVNCFFIFVTMPYFKPVESNYSKKEPWERGCSEIIKFSHCLNFGYCKYGIIFSILNSQWLHKLHARRKNLKWTTFDTFLRRVNFNLIFIHEELASLLSVGKPFPNDLED